MSSCTICPLCKDPGTLASAPEKAAVPCNVRYFKAAKFVVWRCSGCNSLHALDKVDLNLYYDRFPFQNHRLDFHARMGYRNRLRMLRRSGLQRAHRILDYGCGAGLFVEYLREKGFSNAVGYDRFVSAYSDAALLREGNFDAVVLYDVIEHVDDPSELLLSLVDLVVPGGLIVIGTPNADHISLAADKLLSPELSQPYHRHIFSERTLLSLGEKNGLVPEHIHRRFYFDSLFPGVNTRFMWAYIGDTGGMIDAAVEPPQVTRVFKSPRLIFYALFGYFFPQKGNMLVSFRRTARRGLAATSATPR